MAVQRNPQKKGSKLRSTAMTQTNHEGRRSDQNVPNGDRRPTGTITPVREPGRRGGEGDQPWRDPETDPATQPDPGVPQSDEDDDEEDRSPSERRHTPDRSDD
jgi:hypothetical protein